MSRTSLKKIKSNNENYLPEPKAPINLKGIPNRLRKKKFFRWIRYRD